MKKKHMVSGKRILWKAAALAAGAALLAGWILTGTSGISKEDKEIYEAALEMQTEVDQIGFQDFRLADYPVAMYDGKRDYVFYQGKIEKRAPVLETFAGTAYPVEDHFEVIVPTREQLEGLLSLAGGVETLASGSGYEKEEQIATIWHETFHAWQMSNYAVLGETMTPQEMAAELEEESGDEESMGEDAVLVRAVDKNPDMKKKVEQEMKLLKKTALSEAGIDEIKSGVLEYRKLEERRKAEMSKEAVQVEERCELMEGTAYYEEANVLKIQKGGQEYRKRYIGTLDRFDAGRGKYYRTGMAKCMILDRISPDWKKNLDFSKSLDELLDDAAGE